MFLRHVPTNAQFTLNDRTYTYLSGNDVKDDEGNMVHMSKNAEVELVMVDSVDAVSVVQAEDVVSEDTVSDTETVTATDIEDVTKDVVDEN